MQSGRPGIGSLHVNRQAGFAVPLDRRIRNVGEHAHAHDLADLRFHPRRIEGLADLIGKIGAKLLGELNVFADVYKRQLFG